MQEKYELIQNKRIPKNTGLKITFENQDKVINTYNYLLSEKEKYYDLNKVYGDEKKGNEAFYMRSEEYCKQRDIINVHKFNEYFKVCLHPYIAEFYANLPKGSYSPLGLDQYELFLNCKYPEVGEQDSTLKSLSYMFHQNGTFFGCYSKNGNFLKLKVGFKNNPDYSPNNTDIFKDL